MRARFWLVAALGLLLIAAGFLTLSLWLDARQQARDRSAFDARMTAAQAEVEAAIAADLDARAGWLATDPASVAYFADAMTADPDTASISDLLEERRQQLGLDSVGLIDAEGRWIAGTRRWQDSGGKPAGHAAFVAARDSGRPARGLVREESRVFLGVIQPLLRGGARVAFVYAGRELDAALLRRLTLLVDGELALIDDATKPQLWAREGERDAGAWLSALGAEASAWRAPLFGDRHARLLAQPASMAPGDRLPLLVAALAFAAFWLLLLAAIWRRLLQPIDSALGLLERAARGDFNLRAPAWPSGTRGRFASAFDVLMQRVGAR